MCAVKKIFLISFCSDLCIWCAAYSLDHTYNFFVLCSNYFRGRARCCIEQKLYVWACSALKASTAEAQTLCTCGFFSQCAWHLHVSLYKMVILVMTRTTAVQFTDPWWKTLSAFVSLFCSSDVFPSVLEVKSLLSLVESCDISVICLKICVHRIRNVGLKGTQEVIQDLCILNQI